MKRLILIGGGGHARVVIDAVKAAGEMDVVAIVDDRVARTGTQLDGVPVVGPVHPAVINAVGADLAFIAIGDCATRMRIADDLDDGLSWATVIHPSAWVSPVSRVGDGVFIAAMAVIQAGTEIGDHVIVNTAASVDHDSRVHNGAHIGPGARLCGNVTIGDGTLVGTGASVVPGVIVGHRSMIGAGAAVISDVPDQATVVGVPARPISRRSSKG